MVNFVKKCSVTSDGIYERPFNYIFRMCNKLTSFDRPHISIAFAFFTLSNHKPLLTMGSQFVSTWGRIQILLGLSGHLGLLSVLSTAVLTPQHAAFLNEFSPNLADIATPTLLDSSVCHRFARTLRGLCQAQPLARG